MTTAPAPRYLDDDQLVTREDLTQLVDSVAAVREYDEYLKRRWIGMVMWWHSRSKVARRKYFGLRAVVVIGGVLLPVLTTLSTRPGWQLDTTLAIAITGAIVAAAAAWEGVANYGDIWREKRRSAELLKVEGWLFLELCGKYEADKSHAIAIHRFVAEVETLVAREVGEYLGMFDPSIAEGKKAASDIIKTIVEVANERIKGNERRGGE